MTVKISGTFSKENRESNGLDAIRDELIGRPLERVVVAAIVETRSFATDVTGGGITIPTVRFIAIEPVTGADAATLRDILDRARAARTGQRVDPTLMDALAEDDLAGGRPAFSEPVE